MNKKIFLLRITLFITLYMLVSVPSFAQGTGNVASLSGQVDLIRENEPAQSIVVGDEIFAGDILRTGKKSMVVINLPDGSRLSIGENSKLEITKYLTEREPEGLITMVRGRVRAFVSEIFSSRKESFRIKTPTAVVGVQGTDFTVIASSFKTWVEVYEGLVVTENLDEDIVGRKLVGPGQAAIIKQDKPPILINDYINSGFKQGIEWETPPDKREKTDIGSGGVQDLTTSGFQSGDPTQLSPVLNRSDAVPPVLTPPRR